MRGVAIYFRIPMLLIKLLQLYNSPILLVLYSPQLIFPSKIQITNIKVDLWGHQENYHDFANVDQDTQDKIYTNAMTHLSAWKDKTHVCRNYTTICVEKYDDGYFDFIYVDARHDFKGVYADIEAYWPKLKVGGIMAGHDYVTQDDGPEQGGQDWTTNFYGTKDETRTVVKGAVDAFAASVCRQVTVTYREDSWNSWAMRK